MWYMPIGDIYGRYDPDVPQNNYNHRDLSKTIRIVILPGMIDNSEIIANTDGSYTILNDSFYDDLYSCESGIPRLLSMEYQYLPGGSVRHKNGVQLPWSTFASSDSWLFRKYIPTKIHYWNLLMVALGWGISVYGFDSIVQLYRRRCNKCTQCGYSHDSLTGDVCPECGTRRQVASTL